jgi:hypothetical protein
LTESIVPPRIGGAVKDVMIQDPGPFTCGGHRDCELPRCLFEQLRTQGSPMRASVCVSLAAEGCDQTAKAEAPILHAFKSQSQSQTLSRPNRLSLIHPIQRFARTHLITTISVMHTAKCCTCDHHNQCHAHCTAFSSPPSVAAASQPAIRSPATPTLPVVCAWDTLCPCSASLHCGLEHRLEDTCITLLL